MLLEMERNRDLEVDQLHLRLIMEQIFEAGLLNFYNPCAASRVYF